MRYKVQIFNEVSLAWMDVQQNYSDLDKAMNAIPAGKKWRIVCITDKGRNIIASNG